MDSSCECPDPEDTIVLTPSSLGYTGVMSQPIDGIDPAVAEVPKSPNFPEANMVLAVLILAAAAATIILARTYRRRSKERAAETSESKMERGKRYYEAAEYDRAIRCFEDVIKSDPTAKNPAAHYHFGHALRMRGYLCDAIDEWVACSLDDPDGDLGKEAYQLAQRWRAHQVLHDTEECPQCGAPCRLFDLRCGRCKQELKRTIIPCGVCGRPMIREAQLCIHCLPDEIKVEVASGLDWPVVKTTMVDWEAQLIKSRLESAGIPCVLTGEKGAAIPLTVGYLGEIHVRVTPLQLAEAVELLRVGVSSGDVESVMSDPPPADDSSASERTQTVGVTTSVDGTAQTAAEEAVGVENWTVRPDRLHRFWKRAAFFLLVPVAAVFLWIFVDIDSWRTVSEVDGFKIRQRDIEVSRQEAKEALRGPFDWDVVQKKLNELGRNRLPQAEANILRKHLLAEGDRYHAGLDDMSLVNWGISTGRIRRKG